MMNVSRPTISFLHTIRSTIRRRGTIALLGLLTGVTAWTCSIPVFRYALERWPADAYRIEIFYRSTLDAESQALIDTLLASSRPTLPYSNVEVTSIDLESPNPTDEDSIRRYQEQNQGEPELPWIGVHYPASSGILTTVWSGPLKSPGTSFTIDSPLRQTIANQILQGDAAVWVLMECGNRELDEAVTATLESTLELMETTLELPEINPSDLSSEITETGTEHGLGVHFPW